MGNGQSHVYVPDHHWNVLANAEAVQRRVHAAEAIEEPARKHTKHPDGITSEYDTYCVVGRVVIFC